MFFRVRKARLSTARRSFGREERPAPFTPNQTRDNDFSTVNLSGSHQAQGSVPRPPMPLAQQSAYNDEDTTQPIESPAPQRPAEKGGGGFFGWFQRKPEAATETEKPAEEPATAERPKLSLSYKSALTTDMPASGGASGGIQGTGGGQADLDSIGHAMKSENSRRAEAEAKYGRIGSEGMSASYAYPASPLPPRVDLYNSNAAAEDLEGGKQVSAEKSNKKKRIIIIILVILLLVGSVTGVVLAMILPKGKKSATINVKQP